MYKLLKKLSLLILVIGIGIILLKFCFEPKTSKVNENENLETKFGDVYLYQYEYKQDEILNKDQKSKFYLYVISMKIVDDTNIDISAIDINIPVLEDIGIRYKDLENQYNLTESIFKDRVEQKKDRLIRYYIIKTAMPLNEQKLDLINIYLGEEEGTKNIDMIMKLE